MAPSSAASGADSSSALAWRDEEEYRESPNAHPGMKVGAVCSSESSLEIHTLVWGLHPHWQTEKDPWKYFNARSETAATLFKKLFATQDGRCVVVLSGFYEWVKAGPNGSEKQAHYAHRPDGEPLLVAGLRTNGSCTLLTRDVVKSLAWLHDRMPVLLPDADAATRWLQGGHLPADPPSLATHPVTRKMNKMQYQEDDASTPIKEPPKLTAFFSSTSPINKRPAPPEEPSPPQREETSSPRRNRGAVKKRAKKTDMTPITKFFARKI